MVSVIQARNHTHFLYEALELVFNKGRLVSPRGLGVLEVENVLIHIEKPFQKQLFVPLRGNNPIATMAEVLWVLAGRNDMEYLTYYLPRAIKFSDDGKVWRGGYGPRLRNWNGTDQLREVVKILESDPDSRRAVMMIYDPDKDFVNSRDIPCNNQLAITIRDNKLSLKICSRSMDIIWGSTVNIIEWSVLQEILSGILNAEIAVLAYFVSSFHLYTNFSEKAKSLLPSKGQGHPYSSQHIPVLMFNEFSSIDDLDAWLDMVMEAEEKIRSGIQHEIPDDSNLLSRQVLTMFLIQRYLYEGDLTEARKAALSMEDTDFSRAVTYYVEHGRL
jgi:thymidylate synthase